MAHKIITNVLTITGDVYKTSVYVKHIPSFNLLDKLKIPIQLMFWINETKYNEKYSNIMAITDIDSKRIISKFIQDVTKEQTEVITNLAISEFVKKYLESIYGEGNVLDV